MKINKVICDIFRKYFSKDCILENSIRKYRLHYELTQSELALIVGVSKNTISSIERGEYNPSLKLAFKFVVLFDCRFEDLFTFYPLG